MVLGGMPALVFLFVQQKNYSGTLKLQRKARICVFLKTFPSGKAGGVRLIWVYDPEQGDITVIGSEPHPDDNENACMKITLSRLGEDVGKADKIAYFYVGKADKV